MGNFVLIVTTTSSIDEAKILAKQALTTKLAACISIIPNITSIYEWKDQLEESNEIQLIFKTTQEKELLLIEFIKNNHSYEVPEILSIPVLNIDKNYANWIENACK